VNKSTLPPITGVLNVELVSDDEAVVTVDWSVVSFDAIVKKLQALGLQWDPMSWEFYCPASLLSNLVDWGVLNGFEFRSRWA